MDPNHFGRSILFFGFKPVMNAAIQVCFSPLLVHHRRKFLRLYLKRSVRKLSVATAELLRSHGPLPAGFAVAVRHLSPTIHVHLLSEVPPGSEHLLRRWDLTDMKDRGLLGRVLWSTNASVARYVQRTSCNSHEVLVRGQSHQWGDPCFAAFIAAQSWSPKSVDFAQVSPLSLLHFGVPNSYLAVQSNVRHGTHIACPFNGMHACIYLRPAHMYLCL